jgi:hypothetical protein
VGAIAAELSTAYLYNLWLSKLALDHGVWLVDGYPKTK